MVPMRPCSRGSTTMVRLVPIAFGLPGHSPAAATAMLPHSANGATRRETTFASRNFMLISPRTRPILHSAAAGYMNGRSDSHVSYWHFPHVLNAVTPSIHRLSTGERRLIRRLRTPLHVQRYL